MAWLVSGHSGYIAARPCGARFLFAEEISRARYEAVKDLPSTGARINRTILKH